MPAWCAPSGIPTRPAGENTASGEPVEEARQGPGSDVRSGRALPAPGQLSDLEEISQKRLQGPSENFS